MAKKKGKGKKGGKKKGGGRRKAKTGKVVGTAIAKLTRRVDALETSGAALEGATRQIVNSMRRHAGLKTIKKIPGYVSPLGKAERTGARALPPSVTR